MGCKEEYYALLEAFERAGKAGKNVGDGEYDKVSKIELVNKGIKKFKRRVLGFCGEERTLGIGELENILLKIGAVKKGAEAGELIPKMYGQRVHYSKINGIEAGGRGLIFSEIKGPSGSYVRVMQVDYPENKS